MLLHLIVKLRVFLLDGLYHCLLVKALLLLRVLGGEMPHSLIFFRAELMELYKDFCKNYPVITIEDPFDQDDWENTTAFTAEGVSQVSHALPAICSLSPGGALSLILTTNNAYIV